MDITIGYYILWVIAFFIQWAIMSWIIYSSANERRSLQAQINDLQQKNAELLLQMASTAQRTDNYAPFITIPSQNGEIADEFITFHVGNGQYSPPVRKDNLDVFNTTEKVEGAI